MEVSRRTLRTCFVYSIPNLCYYFFRLNWTKEMPCHGDGDHKKAMAEILLLQLVTIESGYREIKVALDGIQKRLDDVNIHLPTRAGG
ncbi:hypothetical protein [Dissulfurimicrobium hydrothermale]|uniref:hypothetical protein n=1 Tax=Dissulfurimicrobium hydrothermale TaxID=1750598 RepID=UPI001EDC8242|nr:hypothetical protein [Dissulfurimicrobium hydrothermale]UKL13918.1 hypothetical protein LGS26_01245 [Dissulfurimicrobium hydrothermale]